MVEGGTRIGNVEGTGPAVTLGGSSSSPDEGINSDVDASCEDATINGLVSSAVIVGVMKGPRVLASAGRGTGDGCLRRAERGVQGKGAPHRPLQCAEKRYRGSIKWSV
jgi:hypothetical protein